jgi:signal transduction histidine kinase
MGDAPERRVRVLAERGDGRCRIEVRDTGPGVPERDAARLFEPFARGRTAAPGFGLGLSTVKRLVVAHRGRVGYEREDDGGGGGGAETVFWLELPEAREPAARHTS